MCQPKIYNTKIFSPPELHEGFKGEYARAGEGIILMLKILRALIYYPTLFTIGLIVALIYLMLIGMDKVLKTDIMPPEEKAEFKRSPRLILPGHYIKFIRYGINFDRLLGFEAKIINSPNINSHSEPCRTINN